MLARRAVTFQEETWWNCTGLFTPVGAPPQNYVRRDPFATMQFRTSDTLVYVQAIPPTSGAESTLVAAYVDGTYNAAALIAFNGAKDVWAQLAMTLPVGANKLISLEESAYITGVWPQSALTIVSASAPANQFTMVGDSIAIGKNAFPIDLGYVQLSKWDPTGRFDVGTGWTNFSLSGEALFDVAATPTLVTQLTANVVARATGTASSTLCLALGTNDFGLSKCSAATYGAMVGAVFASVAAALPSQHLQYLSMFHRTGNGSTVLGENQPNTFGDILSDYISAGVAALPAGVAHLDGFAISNGIPNDVDGLHYTGAGHALLHTAIMPSWQ